MVISDKRSLTYQIIENVYALRVTFSQSSLAQKERDIIAL